MNTFTLDGLSFAFRTEHDDSTGEPWKEHDGHGIVSDWTRRDKRPGERVLNEGRGSRRFYDVAETIKIARRDGWVLGDEDRNALAARLGREPTVRDVTAEAVERDFEHIRAWCNDEWSWVGVVVTLLDTEGEPTGETESLWGIESYNTDYHAEVARELAEQIAARVGDATELVARRRIREDA